MATKRNPGSFDCYAAADPDEPIFILRANDESAEYVVAAWAYARKGDYYKALSSIKYAVNIGKKKPPMDEAKFREAIKCSLEMGNYHIDHK